MVTDYQNFSNINQFLFDLALVVGNLYVGHFLFMFIGRMFFSHGSMPWFMLMLDRLAIIGMVFLISTRFFQPYMLTVGIIGMILIPTTYVFVGVPMGVLLDSK